MKFGNYFRGAQCLTAHPGSRERWWGDGSRAYNRQEARPKYLGSEHATNPRARPPADVLEEGMWLLFWGQSCRLLMKSRRVSQPFWPVHQFCWLKNHFYWLKNSLLLLVIWVTEKGKWVSDLFCLFFFHTLNHCIKGWDWFCSSLINSVSTGTTIFMVTLPPKAGTQSWAADIQGNNPSLHLCWTFPPNPKFMM